MTEPTRLARHWDAAYERGGNTVSWYQDVPIASLALIDALDISPAAPFIDVGGGASTLADTLLDRSFTDVTVLDVSPAGLTAAQNRLGDKASEVNWIPADVLTWQPDRQYEAWHDRAVFHFLTSEDERFAYRQTLGRATTPDAVLLLGTFALDGPDHCSGLPVIRYDQQQLAAAFGPGWQLVHELNEEHVTPRGGVQPFTWAAFRRARE